MKASSTDRIQKDVTLAAAPSRVWRAISHSDEPTTLVEFRLEPAGDGTHLTITESGFDALSEEYRSESFVRNEGGWTGQVENIKRHVDG